MAEPALKEPSAAERAKRAGRDLKKDKRKMRVLDHQYGSVDFARWDGPGGPLEPWDQTIIGNAGIRCGTTDGYIHPDYPSERTPVPAQSGPAINPYSLSTSVPGGGAVCGRTSGT